MSPPFLDAAAVAARLTPAQAADALHAALRDGLDPEADPPRDVLELPAGQLLVMPSVAAGAPAVKLLTLGGEPRIQGLCVVFDPVTLAPAAVIDGPALTELRTPAVSLLAVRHLAAPGAERLLVFGRGPQARAHAEALELARVDLVGRDAGRGEVDRLVAAADVIVCATTAREPLFDGTRVADHACVVAIGSHEPAARETDDALAARATVVVESRGSALREAGDVIGPVGSGVLRPEALVTLADVVRGTDAPAPERPRLFKSTGMSWEDGVVAAALVG